LRSRETEQSTGTAATRRLYRSGFCPTKFIADYLDAEWPEVGYCVGVFRLEGRGVQLFEFIDGSYFTILGMPLLALLGALRDRRAIPS
jgi:septum formation protein